MPTPTFILITNSIFDYENYVWIPQVSSHPGLFCFKNGDGDAGDNVMLVKISQIIMLVTFLMRQIGHQHKGDGKISN